MPEAFFVFDVESVGIQGEGYAAGYVVIDRSGKELDAGKFSCDPSDASGDEDGRQWVRDHADPQEWPDHPCRYASPRAVRERFWDAWLSWKLRGAVMAADCPWPVEARFLFACIAEDPRDRQWEGPYPLIDVASVRLAAGLDPLATEERRENELPQHDPLADSRQSARLLIEALNLVGE